MPSFPTQHCRRSAPGLKKLRGDVEVLGGSPKSSLSCSWLSPVFAPLTARSFFHWASLLRRPFWGNAFPHTACSTKKKKEKRGVCDANFFLSTFFTQAPPARGLRSPKTTRLQPLSPGSTQRPLQFRGSGCKHQPKSVQAARSDGASAGRRRKSQ